MEESLEPIEPKRGIDVQCDFNNRLALFDGLAISFDLLPTLFFAMNEVLNAIGKSEKLVNPNGEVLALQPPYKIVHDAPIIETI